MEHIPVIGFAAYSGTGKTTLIEKLVLHMTEKGIRTAVIKHDGHRFEIDKEGKDSYRYTKAGAEITVISSDEKTARIEQRNVALDEIIGSIRDVDIILVEGYKHHKGLRQIGLSRKACGKGLPDAAERYIAVVTDEAIPTDVPKFGFEEIEAITEFIMQNIEEKKDFTHFNNEGRAKMVNVGEKDITTRTAEAAARVFVNRDTFRLIQSGGMKKGDVLTVAQIAGVMGAKRTPDIIPMCHPILIGGIDLNLSLDETRCCVDIRATVSCDGKTGVEMEALSAVSVAALTVYDMCKAVQKDMVISDIRLIRKTGGVHGDFVREDEA
ncbi:MAG: cyclic pyranopterin monophosphate synthase MoaC [Christensenellaceae bacterium]|nr:cyclic pyranopterin monophosphate synthase MoaC [Christensenellaceae bacterium]